MIATTRRTRACSCPGGFTLLEVLIAIALIGVLLGSMFGFLHELLQSRSRALDYTARQLAAATLIDRIESDLITCVVGDTTLGAGVEGDASRLSILSRGIATHLAGRGIGSGVLGDLQQSEYRFQEGSGLIEGRVAGVGGGARRQTGVDRPPLARPIEDFVSIGPAFKVRFRYHDGDGWSDTFDSLATDGLPAAVEVAVWYHPWPGEPEPEPVDEFGEPESDRLTFDTSGGFDDAAFARRSDLDNFDEPRPDRFRVIVIPDASADDPFAGDEEVGP